MPLLDNNLAYYPMWEEALALYHEERALYDDSRVDVLFEEDIFPDVDFISLNRGQGYGFLRVMSLEERPNPRDIVIYETLPDELPRVTGIITTVPQTPLSHVNLRAVQDGAPNAFIRDALDDDDIDGLIGSFVHYTVDASGYTIRAATRAEVDAHYADSLPSQTQTPERDLTVTEITGLQDIGFGDWSAFGVKAANVAVLRTLGFPEGTVPDGFSVPFYFYDEFMKHNEFYDDIEELLADPEFQSDFDTPGEKAQEAAQEDQEGRDARVDQDRADRYARHLPRGAIAALLVQHQQRRPARFQWGGTVRLQDPAPRGDRGGRHRQIAQAGVCQSVELPCLHRTRLPPHRPPGGDDGGAGASQLLRRNWPTASPSVSTLSAAETGATTSTRRSARIWSPIPTRTRCPRRSCCTSPVHATS